MEPALSYGPRVAIISSLIFTSQHINNYILSNHIYIVIKKLQYIFARDNIVQF